VVTGSDVPPAGDPEAGSAGVDPPGIDTARLAPVLAQVVDARPPLRAALLVGGSSNLTYVVADADGREWVVRRPPLGHVLPTAHDMAREHRVQDALAPTPVPVATMHALVDESVLGARCYVMERLHGVVYADEHDVAAFTRADARAASDALVDTLAALHAVDPDAIGLGDFGRPDGYLERQVRRWSQQWERSRDRDVPEVDELIRRLGAALPVSGPAAIVHGDYNFKNVMYTDPATVRAVLDWEMSTLGDPLADVGTLLAYWGGAARDVLWADREHKGPSHGDHGFATDDEVVERYAASSGRDVGAIDWYLVFAVYKLAVITEGIAARRRQGLTVGDVGTGREGTAERLARWALDRASASSVPGLRG
jgi:aminoglycoside phosphotransferase (APT) family kinase protein